MLGYFQDSKDNKLGISIEEYKLFSEKILDENKNSVNQDKKLNQMDEFLAAFGLNQIPGMDDYFMEILIDQLEGYRYNELKDEEFKHVGGPIILNQL